LLAVHDHGQPHEPMPEDGAAAREVLATVRGAGIDLDALAGRLQAEGAQAFVRSWEQLLARIAAQMPAR
jgi:transaldolase